MTSNKGLLSQLQDTPLLHPHFLAIQTWVSSMVMCVLQATIVLEGVQSQAPVLQVENQHIRALKGMEIIPVSMYYVCMYYECAAKQKAVYAVRPLSFP